MLTESNTHVRQHSFALSLLYDMYNQNSFYRQETFALSPTDITHTCFTSSGPTLTEDSEVHAILRRSTEVTLGCEASWQSCGVRRRTVMVMVHAASIFRGIKCTTKWCNTPNRTHGAAVLRAKM